MHGAAISQNLHSRHLLSRTDIYYHLYIHLHITIFGQNDRFTLAPVSCETLGLVRVNVPTQCARRPFTCSFHKILMHQILIPVVQPQPRSEATPTFQCLINIQTWVSPRSKAFKHTQFAIAVNILFAKTVFGQPPSAMSISPALLLSLLLSDPKQRFSSTGPFFYTKPSYEPSICLLGIATSYSYILLTLVAT